MKIPIYLDENIYCIDFSENEKYQLKEEASKKYLNNKVNLANNIEVN